ncbi:MAG: hypothetical protein V5A79_05550 [Candidatus Bipolaricaulota bacterium]
MRELKVLDLGWGLPEIEEPEYIRIVSEGFSKASSFYDFDTVFFDPVEVSSLWEDHLRPQGDGTFRTNPEEDGGLARGLTRLMTARKEETKNLLKKTGGLVFCKLQRPRQPLRIISREDEREIDAYSWLPGFDDNRLISSKALSARKGKRVEVQETFPPVASVLRDYKDEISYQAVLRKEELPGELDLFPLAITPAGDYSAFLFSYKEGNVIFLPADLNIEESGALELLENIRTFLNRESFFRPPWLDGYQIPGEAELKQEIGKIDSDIADMEKVRQNKTKELKAVESLKGLLSARTDIELERSLGRVLSELGFKPKESCSGIDLLLSPGEDAGFAIKVGAEPDGPVGLNPYRELVRGINDLKIFENEDPQGVVIVNGYAEKDPDKREEQIEEELKSGCNLYGFTLVTAEDIFETISEAKEERGSPREELIDLLQNN